MQHRNQYARGRWRTAYTGQTSTLTSSQSDDYGNEGFEEINQYSAASIGSYEEKQITVQPQVKGYYLLYGVTATSTNIREEYYYMKDIVLSMSSAPNISTSKSMRKKINVRDSFTPSKKRIGGTRL